MSAQTFPLRKKILNRNLVLTVACLFFLVNVSGCSGYRFNGIVLNGNKTLHADSGQIGADASTEKEKKKDEYEKERKILNTLIVVAILGGLFAWFLYEANKDDKTTETSSGLPPMPPPPPLPPNGGGENL